MYKFLIIVIVTLVKNIYTQNIGNPCTHERSNSPGLCKLLTQCKEIRDEIVIFQKLPQTCGFQETQAIVCCPNPQPSGSISETKCREYTSHTKEKQLCGHNIVKRIVGGKRAGRTEFPHMAILGFPMEDSDNYMWLRGGSLISEQYILTAAFGLLHIYIGRPQVVLLGVTYLNDTDHSQEIKIEKYISHPEYNNTSYYHDIGLIKLEKPIEMSSYVRPACLNTHFDIPVGKVVITGWGQTEWGGDSSEDLLKVTLDITEYEVCNKSYQSIRKLKRGIIDSMHICTQGNELEDTCQGDTGGPVQIHHNNDKSSCMYDIVGVVSFGKACGGAPSVNIRVSHYIKWIEDIVWPENNQ
ncbi:serine protease snake-like isoform X1 [Zophobas morio]|uniref:serine protease snake-like isoform X1 n=1 Tax=Zophobas morio TaxID=2755281 RepID=UPI003083A30E